jgi:hypothetical protein
VRPWSAPNAAKNVDKCKAGEEPCGLCGKAVVDPKFWVRVVDGGTRFATKAEFNDDALVDAQGDMGMFAVGPACARKLTKSGEYVDKS